VVTPAPDERTIYTSRLHDGVASAAWPVFSEPALAMLRSAGAKLHPEPGEVLWEAGDPYHLDLVLGDEHVVGAGAGRLLCQEGVVALGEVLEDSSPRSEIEAAKWARFASSNARIAGP